MELEAGRSISFLSLGIGVVPSPSSLSHAKPLDLYSSGIWLSLASDTSLSLATNNLQTENHRLETQKESQDIESVGNEILLFGVKIKAEDSASSSVVVTVDDNQLVQSRNPQVNMGFRLSGVCTPKKKACEEKKLGLQETSKAIKRRVYTQPRTAVIEEHNVVRIAEHVSRSHKENIGELLIENILTRSDIDQSSRLMLSKKKVEKRLIPILPEADQQRCRSLAGLGIQFYDADDEEEIFHTLVLKQWRTKGSVLAGTWRNDFVKRRNLPENDDVGLFWDRNLSRFNFSVKQIR